MQKIMISIVVLLVMNLNEAKSQLYIGNFVGDDSKEINGLGNFEIPFGFPIPIKKFNKNHKIILSPRYTFAQTYFSDKWIFSTDGNTTSYTLDPDLSHEYRPSIWSHQSKIRTWSWEAWLGFESTFGVFTMDVFYAPSYIQTGSFRRKFTRDNEIIKVKDRFREKADYYNINRFQNRVYASVSIYGIGVGGYLNLTPFFKKSTNIDLRKFGITLIIRDNFIDYILDIDDDEPTKKSNPDVKQMMF